MKYINTFKTHASYEEKLNGGGVEISLPNVSYCEDVKDIHYNPYNTVEFYVGEITSPQTVSIYTDKTNHLDVTVNEGKKWYTYVLPKDKGLYRISGNTVNKVVVKADFSYEEKPAYPPITIIPSSTVEASFKGSNTSNVTDMRSMFYSCNSLTSLDLRNFNTSNVTIMDDMFNGCIGLASLDLRNFNTSNVTNMYSMFDKCSGLTSLDLSRFNTSNVTGMRGMFNGCIGLTSLDLSGWNTSKVTDMGDMFNGCSKLKTITMKGCSEATRTKIEEALTAAGIKDNVTIVTE